jgi:hypothetical protein
MEFQALLANRTQQVGHLEPASAISGTSRQKFPTPITSPHIRAYSAQESLFDGPIDWAETSWK